MKVKKIIAAILSFLLILTTVLAGVSIGAKAEGNAFLEFQGATKVEEESAVNIHFNDKDYNLSISADGCEWKAGNNPELSGIAGKSITFTLTGDDLSNLPKLRIGNETMNFPDSTPHTIKKSFSDNLNGMIRVELTSESQGGPGPGTQLNPGDIELNIQDKNESGIVSYSIDNGSHWTAVSDRVISKDSLNGASTISFKMEGQNVDDYTDNGQTNNFWYIDNGGDRTNNYFTHTDLANGTASFPYNASNIYKVELRFKREGNPGPEMQAGDIEVRINKLTNTEGSYGFQFKVGDSGPWTNFPEGSVISKSNLFGEGSAVSTKIYIRMSSGQDKFKPSADNNETDNFAEEKSNVTNHYKEIFSGDKRTALWNENSSSNGVSFDYNPSKQYVISIDLVDKNTPDPAKRFEGSIYFAWAGAGDSLQTCKLTGLNGGNSINYISIDDTINDGKADNNKFSINSGTDNIYYYILWDSPEENGKSSTADFLSSINTFSNLVREIEGNGPETPGKKDFYAVNPGHAQDGANSIRSDGDQEFKLTIYNEDYVGIGFDANPDYHDYLPDFWDETFFSNTLDISGSAISEDDFYVPEFEAFILEKNLTIEGISGKGKTITNITPTGVPEGAVVVNKGSGYSWNIKFNSNFFDRVIFEATVDGVSEKLFFCIVRTAIQVFDIDRRDLIAEVYFDDNEDYTDYEVWATVEYNDGSQSLVKLDRSKIYTMDFDGYRETTDDFTNGGKNLKKAHFKLPVSNNMVGAFLNVTKSGALTGNNFGGSFAGSNEGIYVEINRPN